MILLCITHQHSQVNSEQESQRQSKQAAMLEEALRQPGIPEVMKVYEDWRSAERGLDVYRRATEKPMNVSTTDHANPSAGNQVPARNCDERGTRAD